MTSISTTALTPACRLPRSAVVDVDQLDTKLALSIEDFCAVAGMSVSAAYLAIKVGDLRAVRPRTGGAAIIRVEDAKAFLDAMPAFSGRKRRGEACHAPRA